MKWRIEDWTGRVLKEAGVFDTFEDGWVWIYENVKDATMHQDLYVEEVKDV